MSEDNLRHQFSPSTVKILRMKLRSSNLVAMRLYLLNHAGCSLKGLRVRLKACYQAGWVAQWMRFLPGKSEAHSSNPQNPQKGRCVSRHLQSYFTYGRRESRERGAPPASCRLQ